MLKMVINVRHSLLEVDWFCRRICYEENGENSGQTVGKLAGEQWRMVRICQELCVGFSRVYQLHLLTKD